MILKNQRVIVIRVHGRTGLKKGIKDTLSMMRLYKKHNCVVVPNSPSIIGMIPKVKDYVTWGEIDEETFKELLKKRGKLSADKNITNWSLTIIKEGLKNEEYTLSISFRGKKGKLFTHQFLLPVKQN